MIIEAVIVDYLKTKLSIPTYAEIPSTKPDTYIIVDKIDGGQVNHINAATVSVYSYAPSLYEAADLNEKVKEAMELLPEDDQISSCRIGGGDGRSIDTANKAYRYETIFNVYHY